MLPGMPASVPRPDPRKGTKAWKEMELQRFYALARQHGGLTTGFFVGVALGVSKQRVYQLVEAGKLQTYEVLGKKLFACDEIEEFAAIERKPGRPWPMLAAA
jgi:hypothetical protein